MAIRKFSISKYGHFIGAGRCDRPFPLPNIEGSIKKRILSELCYHNPACVDRWRISSDVSISDSARAAVFKTGICYAYGLISDFHLYRQRMEKSIASEKDGRWRGAFVTHHYKKRSC